MQPNDTWRLSEGWTCIFTVCFQYLLESESTNIWMATTKILLIIASCKRNQQIFKTIEIQPRWIKKNYILNLLCKGCWLKESVFQESSCTFEHKRWKILNIKQLQFDNAINFLLQSICTYIHHTNGRNVHVSVHNLTSHQVML